MKLQKRMNISKIRRKKTLLILKGSERAKKYGRKKATTVN